MQGWGFGRFFRICGLKKKFLAANAGLWMGTYQLQEIVWNLPCRRTSCCFFFKICPPIPDDDIVCFSPYSLYAYTFSKILLSYLLPQKYKNKFMQSFIKLLSIPFPISKSSANQGQANPVLLLQFKHRWKKLKGSCHKTLSAFCNVGTNWRTSWIKLRTWRLGSVCSGCHTEIWRLPRCWILYSKNFDFYGLAVTFGFHWV